LEAEYEEMMLTRLMVGLEQTERMNSARKLKRTTSSEDGTFSGFRKGRKHAQTIAFAGPPVFVNTQEWETTTQENVARQKENEERRKEAKAEAEEEQNAEKEGLYEDFEEEREIVRKRKADKERRLYNYCTDDGKGHEVDGAELEEEDGGGELIFSEDNEAFVSFSRASVALEASFEELVEGIIQENQKRNEEQEKKKEKPTINISSSVRERRKKNVEGKDTLGRMNAPMLKLKRSKQRQALLKEMLEGSKVNQGRPWEVLMYRASIYVEESEGDITPTRRRQRAPPLPGIVASEM